ncbi:hypothetical protein T439DRAFT_138511 [Meredithblackwellia eburnea MCA 4105]
MTRRFTYPNNRDLEGDHLSPVNHSIPPWGPPPRSSSPKPLTFLQKVTGFWETHIHQKIQGLHDPGNDAIQPNIFYLSRTPRAHLPFDRARAEAERKVAKKLAKANHVAFKEEEARIKKLENDFGVWEWRRTGCEVWRGNAVTADFVPWARMYRAEREEAERIDRESLEMREWAFRDESALEKRLRELQRERKEVQTRAEALWHREPHLTPEQQQDLAREGAHVEWVDRQIQKYEAWIEAERLRE